MKMTKKKGRPLKGDTKRVQLHALVNPLTLTIINKLKYSRSVGEFIDFAVLYLKKAVESKTK